MERVAPVLPPIMAMPANVQGPGLAGKPYAAETAVDTAIKLLEAKRQGQIADCSHRLSLGPFFPLGRVYNVCWSDIVFYSLGIALLLWGASLVILGASAGSLKAALQ